MASRAHVIHDYSFVPPARPRRAVRFQSDDKVVLPRGRPTSGAGALLASALIASALTAGLAYAVYVSDVPALSVTEAAPLSRSWEPDSSLTRANVTNQLSGPAMAAPSRELPMTMPEDGWADVPAVDGSASPSSSHQSIDDSAPGMQPAPIQEPVPSAPDMPTSRELAPPYPNPTTTPPDAIAPSSSDSGAKSLDGENPYRD